MSAFAIKSPAARRGILCALLLLTTFAAGGLAAGCGPNIGERLTAAERAKYARTMNITRGAVFGVILVMVAFGALYVASHTGMAGDFGPRFFSAPSEAILIRFMLYMFLSAGLFGAIGSLGVEFKFINVLVGVAKPVPEDGFEEELGAGGAAMP